MGRAALTPAGEAAKAAILRVTPEDLEVLRPMFFTPSAIRRVKLALRDAHLARMAIGLPGDAEAVAAAVHAALARYAASTWRFERTLEAPATGRNALAHQVLKLNGGEVLSVRTLRRLFAPVAKNSVGNGHAGRR